MYMSLCLDQDGKAPIGANLSESALCTMHNLQYILVIKYILYPGETRGYQIHNIYSTLNTERYKIECT